MSIIKNFSYSIIYQILVIILPFITLPYVSRIIGIDGMGVYSYTYSISKCFMLVAMLGLNNYGNRLIAKVKGDRTKLSETFSSIYGLQVLSGIISLISYFLIGINISYEYRIIFVAQSILVISSIFDINWFYFGLEEFKLTVSRNILIKFISTVLIFTLVKRKSDLIIYVLILSISTLVSQIVLWIFIRKYIDFKRIKFSEIVKHIRPNLILFIPVVAVNIYRTMDKIMLSNLSNVTQTGLYESADRIVLIPLGLVTALGTVMLPRMSNIIEQGKWELCEKYIRNSMQFSMFLSIAGMFGILSISERFIPLYLGEEFLEVSKLMIFLAPILVFASWGNVIRNQYLIPTEKDSIYIKSVIIGAIVNFIINILFIKTYGAIGAVIGTIVAEFSVAAYQTYAVRKNLNIKMYWKDSYSFFILGTIMFIIIKISDRFIPITILGVFLQIFIGAFIYIILVYILYRKRLKEVFKSNNKTIN